MKFFGTRNKIAERDLALGAISPHEQAELINLEEKGAPENTLRSRGRVAEVEKASPGTSIDRVPSPDVQQGVKKIEAVTLTWTNSQLYMAYAL
jgi:hypothetical protein